jgi:hypothetical protein
VSIAQEVFKTERIVPIQAKRAIDEGEPDDLHPEVDDRGFVAPEFGPVVSVTKGKTVIVRLTRKKIDSAAPLTVVSSDTKIFAVADPADGKLPNTVDMDVKITGVESGGDLNKAKLRVQFGEKDQSVTIFEMQVWVFKPLDVDFTPHRVTIDGSGTKGIAPVADIPKIMAKVRSIWGHYGINIVVHDIIDETIQMATADMVNSDPFDGTGEFSIKLLDSPKRVDKTINGYFVRQIQSSGAGITLGMGMSRTVANSTTPKLSHPGIILADGPPQLGRNYVMFWAADMAHEIGHFFTLEHVEDAQIPDEREDSWSRRMLMYNYSELRAVTPFPDAKAQTFRPRFQTAGYGVGQRAGRGRHGCRVTLKHLPQMSFDAEAITARKVITSVAGPY